MNSRSTNSINSMQHKVVILGDSNLRGSVIKLRSALSGESKVFGVIRPGAGVEKIVNSFADDLQNLHSQDFIVLMPVLMIYIRIIME
jgi:hypothetical protein